MISTNFYKVEVDCRLVFIIKPPIAAPKCLISDGDWRGNGLRSKTHEPVLFERSEFTGECAELPTESCKLCAAARRCRGLGVKPRVCFSFAGIFFFKQKENAEMRVVHIV